MLEVASCRFTGYKFKNTMRKITFLLVMQLVLLACQKNKAIEGQGIQIPLECNTSEEFSINLLHLFAIDRDNRIVHHETFTSSDIRENTLHTILPLGRYRLALPGKVSLSRKPEKPLKVYTSACHMKKTRTKKPATFSQPCKASASRKAKILFPRSDSSRGQVHYTSLSTRFPGKYPT